MHDGPGTLFGTLTHPEQLDDRKLLLFAVAYCRQVGDFLPDARAWAAVDVAERFAGGRCRAADLDAAHEVVEHVLFRDPDRPAGAEGHR